jgi:2-polyprenyl-6-methoxyphenol hydroxylase-like FAD-dependent oxidoreductase
VLPKEAEVVVVGGGPTGLVLTSMLRQAGHDVLALDRQAEGANDSRAAAIHAKTLKVLRELNVTDRLVAEGVVVPTSTFRDRDRILTRSDFSTLPTAYPFVLTLHQYRTEKILTERMHALGGEVMRPYAVTAVSIVEPTRLTSRSTVPMGAKSCARATSSAPTVSARSCVRARRSPTPAEPTTSPSLWPMRGSNGRCAPVGPRSSSMC